MAGTHMHLAWGGIEAQFVWTVLATAALNIYHHADTRLYFLQNIPRSIHAYCLHAVVGAI